MTTRGRGRRAVVATAALACVVTAGAFAFAGHVHRSPGPGRAASSAWDAARDTPGGSLIGDLDGDGIPDRVHLTRGHRLDIGLAADPTRPVSLQLGMDARLVGLALVGGRGESVVTSDVQVSDLFARVWTVLGLRGRHLVRIATRGPHPIGGAPGFLTSWIAGGRLYDGRLDYLQRGLRQRVVVAERWSLRDGRLVSRPLGLRCWDRSAGRPPVPCPRGVDWAYDAGPHGDLPPVRPLDRNPRTVGIGGSVTHGSEVWSLVRASPRRSDPPHVELVLADRGASEARIPVPWGPSPVLIRGAFDLGRGTGPAALVSEEGGDVDRWLVYLRWHGRIRLLRARGPVAPGGGFTHHPPQATYLSWTARDGRLYTRIGTATPGRYRLYRWHLTGAGASALPVLAAADVGRICIDKTLHTYGRCAG